MSLTKDPMLFGDETERADYQGDVMDKVRAAIESDRAARRQSSSRESAPVLIGAAGLFGGVTESI